MLLKLLSFYAVTFFSQAFIACFWERSWVTFTMYPNTTHTTWMAIPVAEKNGVRPEGAFLNLKGSKKYWELMAAFTLALGQQNWPF